MSADSTDLLRLLGAGAGNVGGVSKVRAVGNPLEAGELDSAAFAKLLEQAEAGQVSSGIAVTIGKDAGVSLSEADLQKLAVAADKAEAAGIRQALVLTGSQALVLDVHTRTIVGKASIKDGVVGGIDGVIRLEGATGGAMGDEGAAAGEILPVPKGFMAANPSLAAILDARRSSER